MIGFRVLGLIGFRVLGSIGFRVLGFLASWKDASGLRASGLAFSRFGGLQCWGFRVLELQAFWAYHDALTTHRSICQCQRKDMANILHVPPLILTVLKRDYLGGYYIILIPPSCNPG